MMPLADVQEFSATTVLVTGAASGIGAAVARGFLARGGTVWCLDRDQAGLERLAFGGRSRLLVADVADEAAWDVVEGRIRAEGNLDVLAHCAGVAAAMALTDMSLAEWRRVLSINLDGAFLATRTALRLMGERGGAIVLVGSASGIRPASGASAYSVSKAALTMLARSAAKECVDANRAVRINVVSPAGVRTPMWSSMPFFRDLVTEHGSEQAAFAALEQGGGGRFVDPEDVANVIYFLASDQARSITGVEFPVDHGYVL